MTFDEFIAKWDGKIADWDKKYGGQCVDLYRYYCHEVLGVPQSPPVTGAADIWDTYLKDYFERVGNTPNGIPNKGDIIIWNKDSGGGFGHVAVFISGGASYFTSFDQNYPSGTPCHSQKHSYKNVLGWLQFRGGTMPPDDVQVIKDKLAWYEKEYPLEQQRLLDKKKELEIAERTIKSLENQLEEADNAHSTFLRTLANNLGSIISENEVIASTRTHLENEASLQKTVTKLQKDIETHIKKVAEATDAPHTTLEAVFDTLYRLSQAKKYKELYEYSWIERLKSLFYVNGGD